MTWTAQMTVTSVVPGTTRAKAEEGESEVTWTAVGGEVNHDDVWKPYPEGHPEADREMPALTSNTEGKLLAIRIQLVIEGDATSLSVGDRLQVSGHFKS